MWKNIYEHKGANKTMIKLSIIDKPANRCPKCNKFLFDSGLWRTLTGFEVMALYTAIEKGKAEIEDKMCPNCRGE